MWMMLKIVAGLVLLGGIGIASVVRPADWAVADARLVTDQHEWHAIYSTDLRWMVWYTANAVESALCQRDRTTDATTCTPVEAPDDWGYPTLKAIAPEEGLFVWRLINTIDTYQEAHWLFDIETGWLRRLGTIEPGGTTTHSWQDPSDGALYVLRQHQAPDGGNADPYVGELVRVGADADEVLAAFTLPWNKYSSPLSVAFSPDGARVAILVEDTDRTMWAWVLDLATQTFTSVMVPSDGETWYVGRVAWTPDGQSLVAAYSVNHAASESPYTRDGAIINLTTGEAQRLPTDLPSWAGDPTGHSWGAAHLSADGRYYVLYDISYRPDRAWGTYDLSAAVVSLDATPVNVPVPLLLQRSMECGQNLIAYTIVDDHQRRDYLLPITISCGEG